MAGRFTLILFAIVAGGLAGLVMPVRAAASEAKDKSGVKPQVINLPSGAGSVQGLGDAFQPQLNTGTASYAVPLTLPAGVGGHSPSLSLSYNGGNGNGPFGMGWRMDVPFIQRQTDKGLPEYSGTDRFVYSAGEELVPLLDGSYRSRIEGTFVRFRPVGEGWEVTQKNGHRWLLGTTGETRQENARGIFAWLAERSTDSNGNEVRYLYRKHEGQIYLREMRYNFPRGSSDGAEPLCRCVRVVLEYDDARPDKLTDYRSRSRVLTAWRVAAIEVSSLGERVRRYEFSYVTHSGVSRLAEVWQLGQQPVKWDAAVADTHTRALPPLRFTYSSFDLSQARLRTMANSPDVRLGDPLDPNAELVDVNEDGLPDVVATDAISGYEVYINRGRAGPNDGSRWEAEALSLVERPAAVLAAVGTQLADMDGDGAADLLSKGGGAGGSAFFYYPNALDPVWNSGRADRGIAGWPLAGRVDFPFDPGFSFEDSDVQLVDLDHDRRVDVLRTTASYYQRFLNRSSGWITDADGSWPPALHFGSPLRFSDSRVKLADMNGDTLDDMVLVDTVRVVYFPSTGMAEFDTEVVMEGSPLLDGRSGERLLADVNGDGLSDLVLVERNEVSVWMNLGGRGFAPDVRMSEQLSDILPVYDAQRTSLRMADMDGDGTADLLYTSNNAADGDDFRYIQFSGGVLSGLLTTIDNGLGRVIGLVYRTSTDYYVDAWDAGAPWDLRSPVPVTVVSRSTVRDKLSGQTYTTDYEYRNAYYDAEEKAFRGFALAQQIDRGEASAPTQVQRIIFDTGSGDESRKGQILQADSLAEGGYCGADSVDAAGSAATAMFSDTAVPKVGGHVGSGADTPRGCFQRTVNVLQSRRLATGIPGDDRPISHTVVAQSDTLVFENTPNYRRKQQRFKYDVFGNAIEQFDYGEVAADGTDPGLGGDERLTYSTFILDTNQWLLDRMSESRTTDLVGGFVSHSRTYYDGPAYQGLQFGQLTRGNPTRQESDTGPNDPDRRWVQAQRFRYDEYGNQVGRMDPNGTVGADGLPGPGGHWTEAEYDTTFHQYPVRETIHLEGGRSLALTAEYDLVLGVITGAREFNGHILGFRYDALGRLTKIIKPGDTPQLPTQAFTYTLGATVSSITSDSREVSGQPGVYRSLAYVDGLGRTVQTRSEGEDGKVVVSGAVTFNARGKEAEKYQPYFDSAASWTYAPVDPTAPKVTLAYDPLGRGVRTTNPDGTFSEVAFRPFERDMADEEDTRSGFPHADTPMTQHMDGQGRVIATVERNGAEVYTTQFGYDLLDNLVKITDTRGNVKTQTFDGLKHKLSMLDPDRGPMTYRYDDARNLLEAIDAKNQRTLYSYDGANRPLTENWVTAPGDATPEIRYHYDADKSLEFPDAANTLGRMAWVEDTSGSEYVSYDARGNPTGRIKRITGADKDFVSLLDYDAMDRPTTLTYPDGTRVDYRYNAQNQLDSIPGFVENIDYTASGQRLGMGTADGVTTAYTYDERLRLTDLRSATSGGSLLQAYQYHFDGASNILGIDDHRPDRTAADDDTRDFTIDGLYRLTSVTYAVGGDRIDYGYDPIGNMTRKASANIPSEHLGDMRHGQGAGPHALTEVKGDSWRYDANGNLTEKPGIQSTDPDLTLTWDFRNRLVSITDTNAVRQDHVFDYTNRRVRKRVATTAGSYEVWYPDTLVEMRGDQFVKYFFVGSQRMAEFRSPYSPYRMVRGFTGTPEDLYGFDTGGDGRVSLSEVSARGGERDVIEYIELNDALTLFFERTDDSSSPIALAVVSDAIADYLVHAAPRSEPALLFYHPDHLGSSTLVVDRDGYVAERTAYFPYGTQRPWSARSGVAYRFSDKELDLESGLYNSAARYYDAAVGRFVSVDPLVAATDSLGHTAVLRSSGYAYARNSPIIYIDPSGLTEEEAAGANGFDSTPAPDVDLQGKSLKTTSDEVVVVGPRMYNDAEQFWANMLSWLAGESPKWFKLLDPTVWDGVPRVPAVMSKFSTGVDVLGAYLSYSDEYARSPMSYEFTRELDALSVGIMNFSFSARHPGAALIDAGASWAGLRTTVMGTITGAIRSTLSFGEWAITGNGRAAQRVHEASKAGDHSALFWMAAESGDGLARPKSDREVSEMHDFYMNTMP